MDYVGSSDVIKKTLAIRFAEERKDLWRRGKVRVPKGSNETAAALLWPALQMAKATGQGPDGAPLTEADKMVMALKKTDFEAKVQPHRGLVHSARLAWKRAVPRAVLSSRPSRRAASGGSNKRRRRARDAGSDSSDSDSSDSDSE